MMVEEVEVREYCSTGPSSQCATPILPPGTFVPCSTESDLAFDSLAVCRICHLPGDDSNELFSPCRCSGTLSFIHYSCLKKWIEISTRRSKKPPKCELCHYQYHRHKRFKCTHCKIPRISRRDKFLHAVFFLSLVIMISCAVVTVMCFLSDKGEISKFPKNKVELSTEEIITLSCGVMFFVSFFIAMTVEIKAKHTVYKLFAKFIMQNMEWKIDSYARETDYDIIHPV